MQELCLSGGQFNRHYELWARNWARNWATFWAKFSTRVLHVETCLKTPKITWQGSGPDSGPRKMSIELTPWWTVAVINLKVDGCEEQNHIRALQILVVMLR